MNPERLAFVAAESSGDLLAAGLIAELHRRVPNLRCFGVGGDRMIEAGFDAWEHVRALSVRGYVEVIRHLPRLLKLRSKLFSRLCTERPAAFVGVDAPDFNLGLEEKLRAQGIRTLQFIAPAIWAWRPERIEQIRRATDHVLLVFPFEKAIFDRAGIAATYVGHPLAAMIPRAPDRVAARARLGLQPDRAVVALLPGSRPDEVRLVAPAFLGAAAVMHAREPSLDFVVPVADIGFRESMQAMLDSHKDLAGSLRLVDGRSHDCLEASDVALVASGTATLEAALFKRPMVIAYRVPALSAWITRRKGIIPFLGLPNILAGEFLVPEFLQEQATPSALADAVLDMMADTSRRATLVERFEHMHEELTRDTASLAADVIQSVARS
ncbi:MAG: lipid-A-disaccharide synthase [Burkholderiaceae bacterium]